MGERDKYTFNGYYSDVELEGSGNQDHGRNLIKNNSIDSNHPTLVRAKRIEEILRNTNSPKYFERGKLKGILGRIKKTGFPVKNYSDMSTANMWNYYSSIKNLFLKKD